MSLVKDIGLAQSGYQKIEWVRRNCPLLRSLYEEYHQSKPLEGIRIALSIHLEAKTALLCQTLKAAGATVYVTGSNPLSTPVDVAAALVQDGLEVFAWYDCTEEEYFDNIRRVLENDCQIIVDDGGDLVHMLHTQMQDKIPYVIGGCEETTTGILRLRAMEKQGQLKFPMVMVNDARCRRGPKLPSLKNHSSSDAATGRRHSTPICNPNTNGTRIKMAFASVHTNPGSSRYQKQLAI